jgi:ABC-2 type transport system permease protein
MTTGPSSSKHPRKPWPVRLVELWRVYAYLDVVFITHDLRTFAMWFCTDLVINVGQVTGVFLLAERFAGIGPWSRAAVVFLLGYGLLVNAVLYMFFSGNILHISRRLGRGQLDHSLVQPLPLWLSLFSEGFMPISSAAVFVPALGLLLWSGGALGLAPTPAWLALFALDLAASVTVMVAFSFLWGSLAFWAPFAAEEISSSAVDLMGALRPFPLDGIAPLLTLGLLSALPVGLVAWLPCRFLLGIDIQPWSALATPAGALALAALAALAMRLGMRHYARTGSQRYSDFGFRR